MSELARMAAGVLAHYKAVGGDDAVVIGYLEKRSTEGAGMSEYQRILNESKNPANWQDTPDPAAVAAVDAFRAAIVAQTALLRTISEQIRLGQAATNGALDGLASTIGHFYGDTGEALAGLAERLEKLEAQIVTYDTNQTERAVTVSGRLSAMEAKLPAQSPNDKMFTQCCERSKKRYWCSLPNGHKGQHIAKGTEGEIFEKWARRKAKR